jgi:hypothetical protein
MVVPALRGRGAGRALVEEACRHGERGLMWTAWSSSRRPAGRRAVLHASWLDPPRRGDQRQRRALRVAPVRTDDACGVGGTLPLAATARRRRDGDHRRQPGRLREAEEPGVDGIGHGGLTRRVRVQMIARVISSEHSRRLALAVVDIGDCARQIQHPVERAVSASRRPCSSSTPSPRRNQSTSKREALHSMPMASPIRRACSCEEAGSGSIRSFSPIGNRRPGLARSDERVRRSLLEHRGPEPARRPLRRVAASTTLLLTPVMLVALIAGFAYPAGRGPPAHQSPSSPAPSLSRALSAIAHASRQLPSQFR